MDLTDALRTLAINEIGGVGVDLGSAGATAYRLPRLLTAAREFSRHSSGRPDRVRACLSGVLSGVGHLQQARRDTIPCDHELVPDALHEDLHVIALPVVDIDGEMQREFYRFQTTPVDEPPPDDLQLRVSSTGILRLPGFDERCYISAEERMLYLERPNDPYCRAVADCGLINAYINGVQLDNGGRNHPDRDWGASVDGGVEDWLDRATHGLTERSVRQSVTIQQFAEYATQSPDHSTDPYLIGLQENGALWLQFDPRRLSDDHPRYRPAVLTNTAQSGIIEGLAAQFLARGHPVVACGVGAYEGAALPHCTDNDHPITRTDIASIDWAISNYRNDDPIALVIRSGELNTLRRLETDILARPNVLLLGAFDGPYNQLYRSFLRTRNRPPLIALCEYERERYEYTAETRTEPGVDVIATGEGPIRGPAANRDVFA